MCVCVCGEFNMFPDFFGNCRRLLKIQYVISIYFIEMTDPFFMISGSNEQLQ